MKNKKQKNLTHNKAYTKKANQTLPQWAIINDNLTYGENLNSFKLSHCKKATSICLGSQLKLKLYNLPFTQGENQGQKSQNFDTIGPSTKLYFETPQLTKCLANKYKKITSDQYRRAGFLGAELERKVLKGLLSSKSEQSNNKQQPSSGKKVKFLQSKSFAFSQLAYNSAVSRKLGVRINALTRIRNRCVLTSHPSTIGKLGISRIVFRTLAGFGQLPGIQKI